MAGVSGSAAMAPAAVSGPDAVAQTGQARSEQETVRLDRTQQSGQLGQGRSAPVGHANSGRGDPLAVMGLVVVAGRAELSRLLQRKRHRSG